MIRALTVAALVAFVSPVRADEKDWTGTPVRFKESVHLGRKLGGGLVRDGAALDPAKTYTVKSDDGTFLELVGETGFVFKSEAERVAKADPIVGTFTWYTGAEFVFRADGTANAKLGAKTWVAKWVANPYGGYVVMYAEGGVDVIKLSADGKKLEGTGLSNGKSYPVSGTKR
jgi:hypothetical protein